MNISEILKNYLLEKRPWGQFEQFTRNESVTFKILTVNPSQAFSEQYHNERDEIWIVIQGSGKVRVGSVDTEARVNDRFYIPRGTVHRITGGPEGIQCIEIVVGKTFREDDIVRIKDEYGRV